MRLLAFKQKIDSVFMIIFMFLQATVMGQHGIIVVVEVLVFAVVLYICRWLPEVEVSRRKFSVAWPRSGTGVTRRKSVDEAVPPAVSQNKKRRPSEEALVIAGHYFIYGICSLFINIICYFSKVLLLILSSLELFEEETYILDISLACFDENFKIIFFTI